MDRLISAVPDRDVDFLKVAAEAVNTAAEGLKADNDAAELTRFTRQRALEDAIENFRPDYTEAFELMHALWDALEKRYPNVDPAVIDGCDDLCVALENAEDA